jgi:isopenicillin-N epimerase
VLAAQREWVDRLQGEPMDFLTRELDGRLAEARGQLGRLLNVSGDDLVFVDNATTGMNIVAGSFKLEPGDEVLATDHEYGAVLRVWQRACNRAGARLVVQEIPCPVAEEAEVIESLFAGLTQRTRLLVFSHVTSPTAVIFPAEAICRRARELGLAVCIDGPHALAMLDVDLARLDCDYYMASCHKWLCAPFGSGFLYVRPSVQATIEPVVMSWGRPPAGQQPGWRDEFAWSGTRDPSPFLSVPAAIGFLESVGLEAFRARTHRLAQLARDRITDLTGLEPLVPDSPRWYGSMIALPLPPGDAAGLQQALWERYQVEVPMVDWRGLRLVRPSCHLYNDAAQIEHLAHALGELLRAERS